MSMVRSTRMLKALSRLLAVSLIATTLSLAGGVTTRTPARAATNNNQTAYSYFISQGLAPYQAAAIVGNFDVESGAGCSNVGSTSDPDGAYDMNPSCYQGEGGPGRGVGQWGTGGRWDTTANDNAVWYAGTQGLSVWSLTAQIEFTWYELKTFSGYGLSQLETAPNLAQATYDFEIYFESPGNPGATEQQRINYAQDYLNYYGAQDGPAVAVDPNNSDEFVFWRGTDGNIWEGWWDGSWHGSVEVATGPVGSEPTAIVRSSGEIDVFWRGTNAELYWAYCYEPDTCSGPYLLSSADNNLAGTPSAGVNNTTGGEYVWWQGTDGYLWEAWYDPSTGIWYNGRIMGPIGSAPTAGVANNGTEYVFWRGSDGNFWEGWFNGSWNGPATNTSMGRLGSEPGVGVQATTSYEYVFWMGQDTSLTEGWWANGWNGPDGGAIYPVGSNPGVAIAPNGHELVFYKGKFGSLGGLWESWWDGSSWTTANIGMGPLG